MKKSGWRHYKHARLAEEVGGVEDLAHAGGICEGLYIWAQDHARDGLIPESANWPAIWHAVGYAGDGPALLAGLVSVGLLDPVAGGWLIHDWADHCPAWVKGLAAARRAESGRFSVTAERPLSDRSAAAEQDREETDSSSPSSPSSQRPTAVTNNGVAADEFSLDRMLAVVKLLPNPVGAAEIARTLQQQLRRLSALRNLREPHDGPEALLCKLTDKQIRESIEKAARTYAGSWLGTRGRYAPQARRWVEEQMYLDDPRSWGDPDKQRKPTRGAEPRRTAADLDRIAREEREKGRP